MISAISEILEMILILVNQIIDQDLFDASIVEKHLNQVNLSGIYMDKLFKLSCLFLLLDYLGSESGVRNDLL